MTDCEFLQSLGIKPVSDTCQDTTTTGPTKVTTITTLAPTECGWSTTTFVTTNLVVGVIPWIVIILFLCKFKRILALYLRDRYEYFSTTRVDLERTLIYEFKVGDELITSYRMRAGTTSPLPVEIDLPNRPCDTEHCIVEIE